MIACLSSAKLRLYSSLFCSIFGLLGSALHLLSQGQDVEGRLPAALATKLSLGTRQNPTTLKNIRAVIVCFSCARLHIYSAIFCSVFGIAGKHSSLRPEPARGRTPSSHIGRQAFLWEEAESNQFKEHLSCDRLSLLCKAASLLFAFLVSVRHCWEALLT